MADVAAPGDRKSKRHKSHSDVRKRPERKDDAEEVVGTKGKRVKLGGLAEGQNFTLEDVAEFICSNPPELMNVRDDQLCATLLRDMNRTMLEDMVAFLLRDNGVYDDESRALGPPKWMYSPNDYYDSFDFYAAAGCPNCGASFDLDNPNSYFLSPPTLICSHCGHRACPLHLIDESEALVDRVEKGVAERDGKSGDISSQTEEPVLKPVYVRGVREAFYFGQSNKEWWQSRYLPRSLRMRGLDATMTTISTMTKFKAPVIKELCEICGNNKAFYTTYQARSADEGMTIMYECTRCHHRKILNS